MEGEQDEMMVRFTRQLRWVEATALFFLVAFGTFLVLRRPGRESMATLALGAFCLLLGAGYALWMWHRDGTPPDAEHYARQAEMRRKLGLAFRGSELLMLVLALFGLLFPAEFGEYWQKHQFLITLLVAGLLSDLIGGVVRWRAAQISDAESR